MLEQVRSREAPPHTPQDLKDLLPTPWHQRPQDTPWGPLSFLWWVKSQVWSKMGHPWIGLIPRRPPTARSDLDLGNLEVKSTLWANCDQLWPIPEHFFSSFFLVHLGILSSIAWECCCLVFGWVMLVKWDQSAYDLTAEHKRINVIPFTCQCF